MQSNVHQQPKNKIIMFSKIIQYLREKFSRNYEIEDGAYAD
ncbi:MAG TPA: hypothetical protein VKT28_13215 [Puia sp.]|nr:hypothetical protein [Puia sp.]